MIPSVNVNRTSLRLLNRGETDTPSVIFKLWPTEVESVDKDVFEEKTDDEISCCIGVVV